MNFTTQSRRSRQSTTEADLTGSSAESPSSLSSTRRSSVDDAQRRLATLQQRLSASASAASSASIGSSGFGSVNSLRRTASSQARTAHRTTSSGQQRQQQYVQGRGSVLPRRTSTGGQGRLSNQPQQQQQQQQQQQGQRQSTSGQSSYSRFSLGNIFSTLTRSPSPPPPRPPILSRWSTPAVEDSMFSSEDFMLGAGMVIIQPSSVRPEDSKVVIVYETKLEYCFLPRGRKDVGESLEMAALREAYEESGYRVEKLPLFLPHHQPSPPSNPNARHEPCFEPVYVTTQAWSRRTSRWYDGGEYIIHWYVGQIPEGAEPETGTGMPDEQDYKSYLVSPQAALQYLPLVEAKVVKYAWTSFLDTCAQYERLKLLEEEAKHAPPAAPVEGQNEGVTLKEAEDNPPQASERTNSTLATHH